jgi:iron-sulfur cluster assembly protein
MISVTDIAAGKIQDSINRRGRGLGIKVGVKTTGCSGLAYTLEYVDNEQGQHCVAHYDDKGVRISNRIVTWTEEGIKYEAYISAAR